MGKNIMKYIGKMKNVFLYMTAAAIALTGCSRTNEIQDDVTLTYWVRLHQNIGDVLNYGETPFAKEYMKRTGIDVNYIHPKRGQETESLNLLIASGELPDIIETDWLSRNPDVAIDDNIIIDLNPLMDDYAPNLRRFLTENPHIGKDTKTDKGRYYVFPFVRNGDKLLSTAGLVLRGDWLKLLDLKEPETIEEWENVLTEFKKIDGVKYPFVGFRENLQMFAGAFGVRSTFYLEYGLVKHGIIEPQYKNFLETMNRWYRNGLIDRNFALMDFGYVNNAILSGSSGVTFGAGGSQLGMWLDTAKNNGLDGYDLIPVKFPAEEKGRSPKFGNKQLQYSSLNGAAITAKCKNPELASKYLDYSYSKEGHILNNFGIEGESYEIKDGFPHYTENMMKPSMVRNLSLYTRAPMEGPFVQDELYIEQYYQRDSQKEAIKKWNDNNHELYQIPQIIMTSEEQAEFSQIMQRLQNYIIENEIKFIIGSRSIEEFEMFVQECKDKKIDRAIEIYQSAYERYLKR